MNNDATKMSGITALPWRRAMGGLTATEIRDNSGNCLGNLFTEEDAAFIVRCCNEWEALEAVAKAAFQEHGIVGKNYNKECPICISLAALAKLRNESK